MPSCSEMCYDRLRVVPIFRRDSRESETRAQVKITASRLSRVGWFSRALAFHSLYYSWGKMGTSRSLVSRECAKLFSTNNAKGSFSLPMRSDASLFHRENSLEASLNAQRWNFLPSLRLWMRFRGHTGRYVLTGLLCKRLFFRLNMRSTRSNCPIYNCLVTTPNKCSRSNVKIQWPGTTRIRAASRRPSSSKAPVDTSLARNLNPRRPWSRFHMMVAR